MEYQISQQIVSPFTSTGLTIGLTTFPDLVILNNGVPVYAPTATYAEIGNGLYTITYTPLATGYYSIFIQGRVQITFQVMSKTTQTFLQNLSDEALGSWTWNKTTMVLTLYRQDGTTMNTYTMADTLEAASRELLS